MRRQAGFTLIEILVVLSLIAVLMGLSVGFITRAQSGNKLLLTTNAVASQLASARAQAYGDSRAYVILETREDGTTTVRSYRNRQVFAWACEDFEKASEPEFLSRAGQVEISPEFGMEGRYVIFSSGGTIELGDPPWLDFVDGFAIRCRIRADGKAGTLFAKGTGIAINLVAGTAGRLGIEANVRLEPDPKGQGGGLYQVRTGTREGEDVIEWASPIIPGRWHDILIAYDRNLFTIQVDGRMRAIRSDRRNELKTNDDRFVIGGGFSGGFDSLVISGIFEDDEDRFDVPEEVVRLDAKGEKPATGKLLLRFRNRSLDPRYHAAPVDLWFRLNRGDGGDGGDGGARRVVRVALSGECFVKRPDQP